MTLAQKAQQVVEFASNAPASVNLPIMIGSLFISYVLQPLAIIVTVLWGCLQIHGYAKREWNRDFLYLSRLFGKGK